MHREKKAKFLIVCSLIVSIIFLMTFYKSTISYAQENNFSIEISSNLLITEYSEDLSLKTNITSIDIDLHSSEWKISDISFNFTNIRLEKETKVVEENVGVMEPIDADIQGYGVQINVTELTLMYGVYIYGSRPDVAINDVYVQIRGYNNISNKPNDIIYTSTLINVSEVPDWYFQKFSTPVSLPVGQYYLVLNGSALSELDPVYFWARSRNPNYPKLYTSYYEGGWISGSTGIKNEPFLYKLVQKVDRIYNPEDINMGIELNAVTYPVTNGIDLGSGNLFISNLNYSPNKEILSIPVKNNQGLTLDFDLNYHIKLKNENLFNGFVKISENKDNRWSLSYIITRFFNNHTINFRYPKSWYNLTIFKDNVDITTETSKVGDLIIINNSSITDGSELRIEASSPKIDFNVNSPTTKYNPGQNLRIIVSNVGLNGNLTFLLFDPFGFEEHQEVKESSLGDIIFLYDIPSNPYGGKWKGYIYWNNISDAGLKIQELTISIPFTLDPQLVFNIVLITILSFVGSISSYQIGKRYKRVRAQHRQKIFDNYMDVLNLNYIIVAEKNSGLNIYEQVITGSKVDLALITGFLDAIRTFEIELSGSEDQSQTIKLEYHRSKILISEFKNIRIITIMKENPSKGFINSLEPLSYEIDNNYSEFLENFDGEISRFKGIKSLIEKNLRVSLVYPLKVNATNDVKLNLAEKTLFNKAVDSMKSKGVDHFYISYLLNAKEFNVRAAERILKLIEKGIFQPFI
ncbi:MAG: hypothetical protein ACFE9M_14040 [Promethearchaeota archaeon]